MKINRFEHFYFLDNNGHLRSDYTLFLLDNSSYVTFSDFTQEGLVITMGLQYSLDNIVKAATITTAGPIPKGTEIWVGPNCSIPSEKLRQCYKIKRGIDSGQYNVLTNDLRRHFGRWVGELLVIHDKKLAFIFAYNNYNVNSSDYIIDNWSSIVPDDILSAYPSIDGTEFSLEDTRDKIVFIPYDYDYWKKVFDQSFAKPCITIDDLDLSSDDALTVDALELYYRAGCKRWSIEAEKNFLLQTNALYNLDWRPYASIIRDINGLFAKGTVGQYMTNRPKSYPKAAQEIYSANGSITDESKRMMHEFYDRLFNIGNVRYCSFEDLKNKLGNEGISILEFLKYYNLDMRITRR